MSQFHLSKWYLDCIADDGTALIGYWARLRWRSLALEYAAALIAPAGVEPRQIHVLRSPPPPVLSDSYCAWRCHSLHLDGDWSADAAPVQMDLLNTPAGGVRWSIHQPAPAHGSGSRGPGASVPDGTRSAGSATLNHWS